MDCNLPRPKYSARSTSTRRLGDVFWKVFLDSVEYIYAIQRPGYLDAVRVISSFPK